MGSTLSPNPLTDIRELLTFPFMLHAYEAGTVLAVLAAIVGWYMVLRRQSFAGHTLAVMAFPGASGAALVGLPASLGYYLACGAAALLIGSGGRGALGARGRETAVIGTVQAVGLAAGFMFLSLGHSVLGGPETLLFGTFLGITSGQVVALALLAAGSLVALAVVARPLLFATIDPHVARGRGVPVGALDVGFLLILGLTVAATSQITGALLVFALLVAPPASAQVLTARALPGLVLSMTFGLVIVWLALASAYFSNYPIGFYVTTYALGLYLAARLWRTTRR
jgi:zinc/manganese transport system permease protein